MPGDGIRLTRKIAAVHAHAQASHPQSAAKEACSHSAPSDTTLPPHHQISDPATKPQPPGSQYIDRWMIAYAAELDSPLYSYGFWRWGNSACSRAVPLIQIIPSPSPRSYASSPPSANWHQSYTPALGDRSVCSVCSEVLVRHRSEASAK